MPPVAMAEDVAVDHDLDERTTGSRQDWVISLDDSDIEAIRELAARLDLEAAQAIDHDIILRAQQLAGQLPAYLVTELIAFRKWSNDHGTLLLRNLPGDSALPATPTADDPVAVNRLPMASATQLLIMSLLGDPISYRDEKRGELIQDVHPMRGREERQENSGSVYLEFHTEDGFHPYKPDFLGLICVRQDHDKAARTASASIRRALPLLSGAMVGVLHRPEFQIRLSSSFGGSDRYAPPQPVLTGDMTMPDMCVDFHSMRPLTDEATWAFNELHRALMSVAVDVALTPRDLIIVDNRVAIHARTAFRPRHDGDDRWLRRMFVVTDLRRSQPARAGRSHVCAPLPVLGIGADLL